MKIFTLTLALSAVLATSVAPALAQGRPDSTRMTCAAATALVAQRGAVVMSTGPHTYDRYVLHRGYCTPSEITQTAFIRTLDNPTCHAGDLCIERPLDNDR